MPQIPSPYEELPLLKDLEVGTRLTIIKVVPSKTQKNGYNGVTLSTQEKGDIFSIDAGVLNGIAKLTGLTDLPDQKEDEFFEVLEKGASMVSEKDPLVVLTSTYKSKKNNKVCATIKNAN